ncbi:MAG TPA: fibronectin type III domain-containing protein [Syntrophales bacterium]|nr:fibronectin type III domain-containing protein [Syntrophales bacterium]HOX94344.1 fibronectin type III domain-containing protein [Syntrophales bacterium]HPI57089.1 fibronectin type III domain-containing protein [Syntrophales bacterium]HPN24824.1 fibronectin type III domain-containing protein [Syntrophales bacterium]HQM30111.1 fibronectin type III domain-containing protein [Syntrophales bacterium]
MSTTHLRVKSAREIGRFLSAISFAILAISIFSLPVAAPAVHAAQISLEWDANDEPDLEGYRIYYGTSSGNYTASVDIGNNTHCVISNLEQGVTYYFAATAYDGEGNESGFSEEIVYAVSAAEPGSGSSSSGGGGGGGCFIATAAYGSYLAPEVMVLRQFRDRVLLTSVPGKVFVKVYYRLSPPVADFIRDHENLRTLMRLALSPLVYGIKYPKASGAIILISLAFIFTACAGIGKYREIHVRNDGRSFVKHDTVSDLRPKGD